MPRYEDDYGRDPRAATVRRETREDRHTRERGEARERTRVIEDPRAASRIQQDPMEVVDARIPTSRTIGDPRGANAAARLEPRPDRHGGADPRGGREQPAYYEDPRTGRPIDPRGADPFGREQPSSRYQTRDDRMDTDDMPTRRTGGREIVDSRYEDDYAEPRSSKYNDYFVPGSKFTTRRCIAVKHCFTIATLGEFLPAQRFSLDERSSPAGSRPGGGRSRLFPVCVWMY